MSSYRLHIAKDAIADLNGAEDWYNNQETGLGAKFSDEVSKMLVRIADRPAIFRKLNSNQRRAILSSSFPFSIYFNVDEKRKVITIAGVLHQSRNPELINQIDELQHLIEEKDYNNRISELRRNKEDEIEKDIGREL